MKEVLGFLFTQLYPLSKPICPKYILLCPIYAFITATNPISLQVSLITNI